MTAGLKGAGPDQLGKGAQQEVLPSVGAPALVHPTMTCQTSSGHQAAAPGTNTGGDRQEVEL